MDLVRIGRGIRALRIRRHWRQSDLARAVGVSQTLIARVELGASHNVPPEKLEKVARALGARLDVRLNYNGEALDRFLDAAHANLVEHLARYLRMHDWNVAVEATFWIRGERGLVDILAWHPARKVVLVVEAKTVVPDVQAMLASIDRKRRLAPEIARDRGWEPIAVATLLAIEESRTSRRRVEAHATTFEQAFPDRASRVKRWLAAPNAQALRGLWFVSGSHGATPRHRVARPRAAVHPRT